MIKSEIGWEERNLSLTYKLLTMKNVCQKRGNGKRIFFTCSIVSYRVWMYYSRLVFVFCGSLKYVCCSSVLIFDSHIVDFIPFLMYKISGLWMVAILSRLLLTITFDSNTVCIATLVFVVFFKQSAAHIQQQQQQQR